MIQPFPISLFNQPAPSAGSSLPVTSDLVAWIDTTDTNSWDGVSNTIYDLSGNGNNFTISGGTATTVDGIPAVYLNGGGSQEIVGPTLGASYTDYSWFVAVKPSTIDQYDGYIFCRRAPGNCNGIGMFISTGQFDCIVNNGTEIVMPSGNINVQTSKWNLLGSGISNTTYDNLNYKTLSGTSGSPSKYTVSGSKSTGSATFDYPIVLGHDREPSQDRNMNGYVAAAGFWNRTLSSTEWDDVITYLDARIPF